MSTPRSGSHQALRRLRTMLALAAAGLGAATLTNSLSPGRLDPARLGRSQSYEFAILLLLAVGLFASCHDISPRQLRSNTRVVLVAITVGVAAKALLTGAVMVAVYHDPAYLLLGIAVAQIDPLSVAVMLRHSRMSPRAKSILTAWASFDDPVTVLLTAYLATPLLRGRHTLPTTGALFVTGGLHSYLLDLGYNALLVLAALAARAALRRTPDTRARRAAGLVLLAGFLVVAARFDLLLGIAAAGLVFRPGIDAWIDRAVNGAFWLSSFVLGVFLVGGADLPAGLLLGATAFAVQILVGSAVGFRLPREDRTHLALGQQNGITAITLALALQPFLPSAVRIIGVAVLVINSAYIGVNEVWRRPRPARTPQPAEGAETAADEPSAVKQNASEITFARPATQPG